MNSVVAFKQKSLGLHGTLSTEVAKGSCAISAGVHGGNSNEAAILVSPFAGGDMGRGDRVREREEYRNRVHLLRSGHGGDGSKQHGVLVGPPNEAAKDSALEPYAFTRALADRGAARPQITDSRDPIGQSWSHEPRPTAPRFLATGDRNANDVLSGRVTDCGNTPVCDPAPAGDGRNVHLLRRHADLRTFLETGAVRSVEVAKDSVSRVAPPVRADVWRASRNAGAKTLTRGSEAVSRKAHNLQSRVQLPSPQPIFIDAEPLSRNVVAEAVEECAAVLVSLFIMVISGFGIWGIMEACLWIRHHGARFHL